MACNGELVKSNGPELDGETPGIYIEIPVFEAISKVLNHVDADEAGPGHPHSCLNARSHCREQNFKVQPCGLRAASLLRAANPLWPITLSNWPAGLLICLLGVDSRSGTQSLRSAALPNPYRSNLQRSSWHQLAAWIGGGEGERGGWSCETTGACARERFIVWFLADPIELVRKCSYLPCKNALHPKPHVCTSRNRTV